MTQTSAMSALVNTSAPTLITDRLILRAHTRQDYAALHGVWSDPIVTKYIGGRPATAQDSWFRIMRYLGHWPMQGYGYFAACDKETGAYIGDLGIANHMRGLHPDFDQAPETGWVLAPAAFGKGYATEGMLAVLAWFEDTHGKQRTVCMIETAHAGSHNVATKLGYQRFAGIKIGEDPITLLERL
jgi:RimJ/RimL family protein N-acetyltransferase